MNHENVPASVLKACAGVLATQPYSAVSLPMLTQQAGLQGNELTRVFESMHSIGTAILTYEGNSMRTAQRQASLQASTPLNRLQLAFRLVGENLANDVIVRAGIRIAAESHRYFPERNINPFRTWQGFVSSAILDAQSAGEIRDDSNIDEIAWLITAAGLGTKDLLEFTGRWEDAPKLLERTVSLAVRSHQNEYHESGRNA